MKRFFLLFFMLPFSLSADENTGILENVESTLNRIEQDTNHIDLGVDEVIRQLKFIYSDLEEIAVNTYSDALYSQQIRNDVSDMKTSTSSILTKLEELRSENDSNLESIRESMGDVKSFLYAIEGKINNIYLELQEGFSALETSLTSVNSKLEIISLNLANIEYYLQSIETNTQNIYSELLEQGLDIKEIIQIIKTFSFSANIPRLMHIAYLPYSSVSDISSPNITVNSTFASGSYTNLSSFLSSILVNMRTLQTYGNNMLGNQVYRLYDIQTNLYSIASALTDKTQEQQITNQFDNVANTFKDDMKQDYEGSKDDLNDLEEKIKAQNQSFQQNQSNVYQFQSLVASFQVDSLPNSAVLSIVNFKLGEDSSLPSNSAIEIDIVKFALVFKVIRGCFTVVYWGIVLFLGYKITFFFVRFVRSNVLGIIPSVNKSDDGSFS